MLNRLLDRPVGVSMVMMVLVILGIVGATHLPVSLIPDVDIPYVTVQVNAPELDAAELDNAVLSVLRSTLVQVEHLTDLKTESRDGSATISLTFDQGSDVDYIYIDVNERIDRAMASLPRMDRPKVMKASAADIPSFFINVSLSEGYGSEAFAEMSEYCRGVIAKRLEQLSEVAMVDISGCTEERVLIVPDEEKLRSLEIVPGEFEQYVKSADISLPNLTIRDGEYHYNVKFRSFIRSAEDIRNIYFSAGDRILQIRDVARVEEQTAPRTGMVRSDGADAVAMAVIKQSDAKMSSLRKSIGEQLRIFSQDYPFLEFTVTRDQTALLDYSINNLLQNIILAVLLCCLVIFLFMKDLRTPLLVAFTIPVSLIISFLVFYLIGLSINIISLSGLILGVGMMVDNSIILTDNITARWNRGEELRTAIVEGTKEVVTPMLSSVLTTCAVFIPLIFLNGLAGEMFYDQAMAVTIVLLCSYLVSVIAIPVYYWRLYRKHAQFEPNRTLAKLEFRNSRKFYDTLMSWCLDNKWISWFIPAVCVLIIAGCVIWMPKEKLPPVTYTDTLLNIDWNEHISIEENARRVQKVEHHLTELAYQISSFVGVQQFVLGHSGDLSSNEAEIYFNCTSAAALGKAKKEVAEFISGSFPSARMEYSTSGNIFDLVFSEKEPQLLAHLRSATDAGITVSGLEKIVGEIRGALPRLSISDIPLKTDVLYVADPELMSLYGVGVSDLLAVLKNALNGNILFDLIQGDRSIPVVLGLDSQELEDILNELTVTVRTGSEQTYIPVSRFMRQTFDRELKSLVSGGEGRYYPLALDVKSGEAKTTMADVKDVVKASREWDVDFTGAYFSNLDMLRQMFIILLVAIALLYLILASQFESLIQPVIILSEVVIDIAVSLAFLWMCGVSINLMSLIGLIVICGIVINDSILKIDTINNLVRSGMDVEQSVHEAGHRRFKSIIMTSITTILSVAPFLSRGNMGADLQFPMALVIIVGMTVGTMVSLFFVPAVYSAIYSKK